MIKIKVLKYHLLLISIFVLIFSSCTDSSSSETIDYDLPENSEINLSYNETDSGVVLSWNKLNIEGFQNFLIRRECTYSVTENDFSSTNDPIANIKDKDCITFFDSEENFPYGANLKYKLYLFYKTDSLKSLESEAKSISLKSKALIFDDVTVPIMVCKNNCKIIYQKSDKNIYIFNSIIDSLVKITLKSGNQIAINDVDLENKLSVIYNDQARFYLDSFEKNSFTFQSSKTLPEDIYSVKILSDSLLLTQKATNSDYLYLKLLSNFKTLDSLYYPAIKNHGRILVNWKTYQFFTISENQLITVNFSNNKLSLQSNISCGNYIYSELKQDKTNQSIYLFTIDNNFNPQLHILNNNSQIEEIFDLDENISRIHISKGILYYSVVENDGYDYLYTLKKKNIITGDVENYLSVHFEPVDLNCFNNELSVLGKNFKTGSYFIRDYTD